MSKILKIIIAIVGLIILWLLTLYFRRSPIEQDLTRRVEQALNQPEYSRVVVSFEGRDGTLTGEVASAALKTQAARLAGECWGVRVIDNQLKVPAEQAAIFATLRGVFRDGKFILSGTVPSDTVHRQLIQKTGAVLGTGAMIDSLSLDPGVQLPDRFVEVLTTFLGLKGIEGAGFSFSDGNFVLTGTVPSETMKNRIGTEVSRALAPIQVHNNLRVIAPAAAKLTPRDLQKFFDSQPIEFHFGSFLLTKRSRQILDRAFDLLKQVPEANFVIEGHTDNIGSHDYNMRLSRSRAISARLYLLEKGIKPERLTVKAYGETKPKADNNTEAGRQRNRRVEFRLK